MKKRFLKLLIFLIFVSNFQIKSQNQDQLVAETATPILVSAIAAIILYFKNHPNDWNGLKNLISRKKTETVKETEISSFEKRYNPMQQQAEIAKIEKVFDRTDSLAQENDSNFDEESLNVFFAEYPQSADSLMDELSKEEFYPQIHRDIAGKLGISLEELKSKLKENKAGIFKDGDKFYKVLGGEIVSETVLDPIKYVETTKIPKVGGYDKYLKPEIVEYNKGIFTKTDPSTILIAKKESSLQNISEINTEVLDIHSAVAKQLDKTPEQLTALLTKSKDFGALKLDDKYYQIEDGKLSSVTTNPEFLETFKSVGLPSKIGVYSKGNIIEDRPSIEPEIVSSRILG